MHYLLAISLSHYKVDCLAWLIFFLLFFGWCSKKQPTVALSSTEVEYRGAALAACEIDWLCKLLDSLGLMVDYAVVLYCDNMSSIKLANNPMFHARTKHIKVHYYFI